MAVLRGERAVTTGCNKDVLLNHYSADKPRGRRLAERLGATGLRVWHVPPKLGGEGGSGPFRACAAFC